MEYVTNFPDYFVGLVTGLSEVQMIAAAVIALFFGIAAGGIGCLLLFPAIAAVVYLAVEAALPMMMEKAAFEMPAFDMALLQKAVALYILMLAAMVVVFAAKKVFLAITGK